MNKSKYNKPTLSPDKLVFVNSQVYFKIWVFLLTVCFCSSCALHTVQKDIPVKSSEILIPDEKSFIVEVNTLEKNTDVIIPIISVEEYVKFDPNHVCKNEYIVNCGDGKLSHHTNTEEIHCFFENSGLHYISISGQLHGLRLIEHKDVIGNHSYYFTQIKQWGTIPWHDLSYFADGCKYLKISAHDAPNLKFTKVIDRMFSHTRINDNINHWDVSEVESMHGLFMGNEVYNQPMDKWNTSKVFNMSNMFEFATSFNQPIGSWDVSSVTNMMEMFYKATNFNQPLNTWNVTHVKDMTRMFLYADAFTQDISNWDFSGIQQCLIHRESSDQNCITYMFSYSNQNPERKGKYDWLETMFEDEYVLCNIDDSDCSLYGD